MRTVKRQAKVIVLTDGCETLVDTADYERFSGMTWTCGKNHTGAVQSNGTSVRGDIGPMSQHGYLARMIMDAPAGTEVDHRNHNVLDNRKANLRVCTRTQNLQNRKGWSKYGYKGVRLKPARQGKGREKWAARITVNGKRIEETGFLTPEAAAARYNELALEHFGEFAYLNDLPGQ